MAAANRTTVRPSSRISRTSNQRVLELYYVGEIDIVSVGLCPTRSLRAPDSGLRAGTTSLRMTKTLLARPDYSGEWLFSAGSSRLQIGSPDAVSFTIEHHEPSFRLERLLRFGDRSDTFTIELVIGNEHEPIVRGDAMLYPSMEWDAEQLVLRTTIRRQGELATNLLRYHLEDDGAVLVAEESYRSSSQSYDNRWVFRKDER